jgi:hypothetical protein
MFGAQAVERGHCGCVKNESRRDADNSKRTQPEQRAPEPGELFGGQESSDAPPGIAGLIPDFTVHNVLGVP